MPPFGNRGWQFPQGGILARLHATLRELPATIADATGKQQLADVIRKNDADVGPEALGIYLIVTHGRTYTVWSDSPCIR